MRSALVIALAACGSPALTPRPLPPSQQPPPQQAQPLVSESPAPAPVADPPAQPDSPSARIIARLPIQAGVIPGTRLTVTARSDETVCGATALAVAISGDPLPDRLVPAGNDEEFEAAMTIVFPAHLDDLDASRDRGLADVNRFGAWNRASLKRFENVSIALRNLLAKRPAPRPAVAALGRLVELERRFAEIYARAPIPSAFLGEPQRSAWCDSLASQVTNLVDSATEDAAACRKLAREERLRGWWDEACR
jgi:hypothetical protein